MTIKDLVEILSEYPEDTIVRYAAYGGLLSITSVSEEDDCIVFE